MNKNKLVWLIPILMVALLPACSPAESTVDTLAIYTAAANTVQAELTNAALLTPSPSATATVTVTVPPTAEASPTLQFSLTPAVTATTGVLMDKADLCNNCQSVADGTNFTPGTSFRETWTFRNVGPTEWTNMYSIKYYGGEQMGAVSSVALTKNVKYNESIEVSVDFVAPATLGAKRSTWCLFNASNQCFYEFWIDIIVVVGAGTTPSPTTGVTPTT